MYLMSADNIDDDNLLSALKTYIKIVDEYGGKNKQTYYELLLSVKKSYKHLIRVQAAKF